jgi:RNA polymerase-interacting CarD/CdnL/TRCF family regulator
MERRKQLLEKIRGGKLEAICQVVRDLSCYSRAKKLNDYDKSILEQAERFLLNEWKLALSVSTAQAERELEQLLTRDTRMPAQRQSTR